MQYILIRAGFVDPGEQFCLCRGCTGINIGEVFIFRLWGNKAIHLGRLDSGHIVHFIFFLCNKWLYPETIIFCLYSNFSYRF